MLEAKPREGKNLLQRPAWSASTPSRVADPDAPGSRELEHARRVNLEYAANMPNFVADETAKRYRSTTKSPDWRAYDTVEAEITFRGRRAVRQQIRRNGKPWDEPFDELPGFKWYEGFETEITPAFRSQMSHHDRIPGPFQNRRTATTRVPVPFAGGWMLPLPLFRLTNATIPPEPGTCSSTTRTVTSFR